MMPYWAFDWWTWVPGWNALQNFVLWMKNLVAWILTPDGLAEAGQRVLYALIDLVKWVLPEGVESHVTTFQSFVGSPAFLAICRIGAWFIDQVLFFEVIVLILGAYMVWWTICIQLRLAIWLWKMLPLT